MPAESSEATPIPEPEDSGVDPSQVEAPVGAGAIVPVSRDPKDAIGQSQFTAAIREAASAFRDTAPQVILARWSEDLHRRMDKRDEELAETREQLTTSRERCARLEERLQTIGQKNAAQDLLKVAGGALLGSGIAQALSGSYALGGILIIGGALLAYFGGASILGLRRNG